MEELRYERKFLAEGASPSEVFMYVKTHPALFREAYPPRRVNNVYFDTAGFSQWRAHVDGSSRRNKIRVRWYGQEEERISSSALEIKRRVGAVGYKKRYSLAPWHLGVALTNQSWRPVFDKSALPGAVRVALCQVRPVLVNSYRRSYWVSNDKCWRLTVDFDLCFSRSGRGWLAGDTAAPDVVILELKYGVAQGEDSASVAQSFPWRADRCSKYITQVRHLYG